MTSETDLEKPNAQKKRSRKKQLYQSILQQIEFYFSDANLAKDRFLSQLYHEKGSVDLCLFLSFNKMRKLTTNVEDILTALKHSKVLSVNEESMTVKRLVPISFKPNEDLCTVYVEQVPLDSDMEWVKEIFSPYGGIDYISLPKFKNGKLKGFGFVEFSTPEIASVVIEDYKKAGNYLSSEMDPEKLCSISTFSPDNEEIKDITCEPSDCEKSEKKESFPVKEVEEFLCQSSGKNKRKDLSDEDEGSDAPKTKKQKNNEENEDLSAPETQKLETDEDGEIMDENKKKKNRKKKKKSKKERITAENSGLQILSKTHWKMLRNRYLNIQRQKMKLLKRHIHQNNIRRGNINFDNNIDSVQKLVKSEIPLDFSRGIIVKGTPSQPIVDRKQLKEEAKQYGDVKYVDAKEGATEIYFRLASPGEAKKFIELAQWRNLQILEGEEEVQYWQKIEENRKQKFNKKATKERGKTKLIRKAEKVLGKHIIFEETIDEETG